jgi:hypothetical protein
MRKITLNESEMINFVSMITERVNLEGYTDEDFIEVFVNLFRPWVKSKHGDEVGQHPMSYLVKKYIDEFISDVKLDVLDFRYESGLKKFVKIGREIVRSGIHKLPSLNSGKKFTEQYKKHLEFIISTLNLPEYINLKFTEDSPNKVYGEATVDFQKLIKSQNNPPTIRQIAINLTKYFEDYLGIEYGSPVHGKLDFYLNSTPTYVGLNEWTKNEFNKNIKKEIKNLPSAERNISSLKLILDNHSRLKAEIKIGWKRDSRWSEHNKIKEEVRNILKSMGYNPEILEVTST